MDQKWKSQIWENSREKNRDSSSKSRRSLCNIVVKKSTDPFGCMRKWKIEIDIRVRRVERLTSTMAEVRDLHAYTIQNKESFWPSCLTKSIIKLWMICNIFKRRLRFYLQSKPCSSSYRTLSPYITCMCLIFIIFE